MPDFLVSAATGALSPVLGKLAALLSDEYKRFKGVRGEVEFLIRELEAMHAFLLKKSEEENPDAQDKVWMKEVRELSYDIEDSLDDFRVRIHEDSTKPDGFIDKCKNLLAKTKARRRIAKAIQDLKLQVEKVSARNQRYKIGKTAMSTSKVTVDPRALAIFEDASRLVGIDKPKQEVISFLKVEDGYISSQHPKVVSIVGIGGIGKTTIANSVYEELKNQFQCRAFLSVSRNPDMAKILRTILSQVTGQPFYRTEGYIVQQLFMEIREFLQAKRYFIVVDDVWYVETWDTIKYALSNNSCGSVIITTTRIHGVAKACCSLYSDDGWVYQPKPLQEHDSKRLFQNRIFGLRNECPENLKEVSDKILKKCGGLPLAIIAISGLLANKARNGVHSVVEWNQVQTSIGCGLERDLSVEGMMGILSLSYFDLPHHLKACLLYLSLFPEDYKIGKKRLVWLWVAEGFIPAESTCTLYESGEKYFNELINRNLILPEEINEWTGEVHSCRLHDTILDFIVCKSSEDNFVTVHGIPRLTPPPGIKVRRLSLQGKTEGDMILHSNQNYENIRSMIIVGFPCSLLDFRFLRVLDFTSCGSLKNHHLANIGKLLQLRYLSLRGTWITELPEQIGELQYLETLDLLASSIIKLPTTIIRLKRLVNLLLCLSSPKNFPCGIKNLQALEELNLVNVDIDAAAICVGGIGELTKLRDLDIKLFFSSNTDESSCMEFVKQTLSSVQRLNTIQTLSVKFGVFGYEDIIIFDKDDILLEAPWYSASLRKLVFKIGTMLRVPSWMESLVNIEELELGVKKFDQESLCILGGLPILVILKLVIVTKSEGIPCTDKQQLLVSSSKLYRSLRFCRIRTYSFSRHFNCIPMLLFEAGSMPKLEQLLIDFDADITVSVSNGNLDFGLKHLSQLTSIHCGISGSILNFLLVEGAIQKVCDNHPMLRHFRRSHYPYPSTVGDKGSRESLKLQRLFISRLRELTKRPPSIVDSSEREGIQGTFGTLPLHMDLSFTIDHAFLARKQASSLGPRHGQQRCRRWSRSTGTTIFGQGLVQDAIPISDCIKGTSGSPTCSILGPLLIAAPHEETLAPSFTFNAGSPPNAESEQQALASYCYNPVQHGDVPVAQSPAPSSWDLSAFSSAFNSLSLGKLSCNDSGSSAMVEVTSDTRTETNGRRILVPRRRSSGRTAK